MPAMEKFEELTWFLFNHFRSDLIVGDITREDVFAVFPFNNTVDKVTMKGRNLLIWGLLQRLIIHVNIFSLPPVYLHLIFEILSVTRHFFNFEISSSHAHQLSKKLQELTFLKQDFQLFKTFYQKACAMDYTAIYNHFNQWWNSSLIEISELFCDLLKYKVLEGPTDFLADCCKQICTCTN